MNPRRTQPPLAHLATLLLLFAACGKDDPVKPKPPSGPSVPSGTLAFRSSQDGEVYTVGTDGSNLRKLTATGGGVLNYSWSPDGAKFLFVATGGVWTVNGDGTGSTNVAAGDYPSWSPDGTKILHTRSNPSNYSDVWVMNANGTGAANLSQNGTLTGSWSPAWSPDGSRIVFMTVRRTSPSDITGTLSIERMNADGSGRAIITTGRNDLPSWSADGTQVVFLANRSSDPYEYRLLATDAAGTTEHAVYPDLVLPETLLRAPDGRIVLKSPVSPSGVAGYDMTYLAPVNGTTASRLSTALPGAERPSWSPDGAHCVVETGSYLHVIRSDGTDVAEIPNTFQATDPVWRPGN